MATWKGIVGKGFTAAEFAAYVGGLTWTGWRPSFVVLHNTGSPTFAQWHQVPGEQRMKNLETYYRDTQKWSAGPHLFIADDLIWVFTPLTVAGVHSPSWNRLSWGVELVGDYAHEAMPDSLRLNALSALAVIHAALGLDPATLRLHREDPLTTHQCPGSSVVKGSMIAEVQAALAAMVPGDHPLGSVKA